MKKSLLSKKNTNHLSQELALTFNSSKKFEIMQQMNKIESKINKDIQYLRNQQEYIENEKRKIRIKYYQTKTTEYQAIARNTTKSIYQSNIPQLNLINYKSDNINDSLNNLELIISLLYDPSFLTLVEQIEKNLVTINDIPLIFKILYKLWQQLDFIEFEIKTTREMINVIEQM